MSRPLLSNAEIADRLLSLAQMLSAQKENPFKIKAYRRAAQTIRGLSDSIDELVRRGIDLTAIPGIGQGISAAIREIVLSGTLEKLERLRAEVPPEIAAITEYPGLDPKRVLRIYKKLKINSVTELKEKLESGAVAEQLGERMAQHVRQALTPAREILLYHAQPLAGAIRDFIGRHCRVRNTAVTGAVRRKVEVISELSLLLDVDDMTQVVDKVSRYGGRTEVVSVTSATALFRLAAGITLRLDRAERPWGLAMVLSTGSEAHVRNLTAAGLDRISNRPLETEEQVYDSLGLQFIPPELRDGSNEVERAARNAIPVLVGKSDIRGDLHAHTTASDGSDSIAEMAAAAGERGYQYLGITDHSQSLKIARGLSEEALRLQIREIDRLNERLPWNSWCLKSAEVDILADGSLDYPDDLLQRVRLYGLLHPFRFALGREQQTERMHASHGQSILHHLGTCHGRLY